MGKYLNSPPPKFFPCGVCGADVPGRAKACPDCGADEHTGLHGDGDGLSHSLPDEDFSYDDFVKREFCASPKPQGLHWVWWVTGVLLLAAMIYGYIKQLH